MATPDSMTAERLRSLFFYDPDTGLFARRKFDKRSKSAGRVGSPRSNGYLVVCIDYRRYFLHRLAWLYVYGTWPNHEIDHINGVRADNRIANLRDVTHQVNMQNLAGGSKFGYVGRFRDGWRAQLQRNRKRLTKTFATEQECYVWLREARREAAGVA